MSAGFTRRFGYFPPQGVLTAIEGIVIVDLQPPAPPAGVGTGVVAIVGEFADQTLAVSVVNGQVTAKTTPVQIFSGTDLVQKTGQMDPTIGDFGNSGGNGFVALRNKSFSTLIVCGVSILTSSATPTNYATRLYRLLPGCTNATSGAINPLPITPVTGFAVQAPTQFLDSSNHRFNSAGGVSFTGLNAYATGVNAQAAASTTSGNTQTLTFDTGTNFTANGAGALNAQVGDVVVVGSTVGGLTILGAAGTNPGASANVLQLRVTAVAPSGNNTLTVEMMDGEAFDFATAGWANQPWRLHHASDADSAGVGQVAAASGTASGYTVPTRALDATATSSASAPTKLTPQVAVQNAQDATWLPSNGLSMLVQKGTTVGPVFITGVTSVNPTDPAVLNGVGTPNASLDANYNSAIQALLQNTPPQNTVNVVFSARHSASINKSLQTFVDSASAQGIGRMTCIAPPVASGGVVPAETFVLGPSGTAVGQFDQAVAAIRDLRVIYSWPGVQTFVPELVGTPFVGADANTYVNGVVDIASDGWLAAVLSNLPPENNPGQAAAPVPTVLSPIAGYQRGLASIPGMNDYIAFKAAGICAPRFDATVGWIFQSGVSTFNAAGPSNINQQRFNDFVDDSLAQAIAPMSKLPLTDLLKDTILTTIDEFWNGLLSPNNPAAQRIVSYSVDDVSGNTPTQLAAGIFVVISQGRMLPTADTIVLQDEVGPQVVTSTTTFPG